MKKNYIIWFCLLIEKLLEDMICKKGVLSRMPLLEPEVNIIFLKEKDSMLFPSVSHLPA